MLKHLLYITGFFLLSFTILTAQKSLEMSLEECIKYGLENNKGIKIAGDKVKSARLKKDEVNTSGLPSLSLQAGYTRLSEVDPFTITVPMGGTSQSFTVSPSLLNSYSTKLTLTQPVFTGFKIDLNKDLSDQSITASMFDLESEKTKLKYAISNAYWSLYKVTEGKKVLEEYIKTIELHLKDLNNFYAQGLITKNEVLKLDVQLSSAQVQLLETENGIQMAKLNLLNNLNLPMDTDISLKPLTTMEEIQDVPSLEVINSQALNTRPELKAMAVRIKSRETAIKLTESAWYPDIYLIGNYNYARPNQRIVPTKDQFDGTWDVTLSLQYTLWNWNATSYRTQQAESDLSQTNYQYEMMKDGVLIEVKQAYLNYAANKSRINLAEKTVTQAEENYRISYNLFQKGLIRNSDLIDAEVAVFESKIKLVTSISDLKNAEALLNKAIGI
ncbi:MAG: TolC family protein [Ignavibacteriales bacterium]|jgi:outer membrane protein TolC|nr:TolC family protein [Ignavibacteriales bacterium]MBK8660841.1 TolC family protein [Ignavibacteriales bacterium]